MKNFALLLFMLVLTALAALAQQDINFADLPDVSNPTPLPIDYQSLNWSCMVRLRSRVWPPKSHLGDRRGFRPRTLRRARWLVVSKLCGRQELPASWRNCCGRLFQHDLDRHGL